MGKEFTALGTLLVMPASTYAATTTLSGLDLMSQPNVTSPAVTPTVVATSLFFPAPISGGFGKQDRLNRLGSVG